MTTIGPRSSNDEGDSNENGKKKKKKKREKEKKKKKKKGFRLENNNFARTFLVQFLAVVVQLGHETA